LDSINVKAPYARRARFRNLRAYTWLLDEQCEHGLEVLAYGSWRSRAVGCPPFGDTVDLSCRAARDE
jgi:hypothetical protein